MSKILIYDFDGTLTPYPVPRFPILEKCGVDFATYDFVKEAREKALARNVNIHVVLFEMYLEAIRNSGLDLVDSNFALGSDKVVYNKGVYEFLAFMCEEKIKNYLVSSGLKVFLDQTEVAPFFKEIYATTFSYNENNEAIGIDYLMDEKSKVPVIKKIMQANGYILDDCSDVIYIGDGLTDFYAMDYVYQNGGKTIFVYRDEEDKDMEIMKTKNVVSLYAVADFSNDRPLSNYVKKLINTK